MNGQKLLYCFGDPLGAPDSKIGMTELPDVRLGVYQNSYSRSKHIACFDVVYIGKAEVVSRLEDRVKYIFYYEIDRNDRGHSEWIMNKSVVEIEKTIDEVIEGNKFKVQKVSPEFLPLTVNNLVDFMAHYKLK